MRPIGIIGGLSWRSTAVYYEEINRYVGMRLGGTRSAEIILHSVDHGRFEGLAREDKWPEIAASLCTLAASIEQAGAGSIFLACNSIHRVFDEVATAVRIPVIHIAETAGCAVREAGLKSVGLLGSHYTTQRGAPYRNLLENEFALSVHIPTSTDQQDLDQIIYEELCRTGTICTDSQEKLNDMIEALSDAGAEGVILGCTEFSILDLPVSTGQLFDTARLHAQTAGEMYLSDL